MGYRPGGDLAGMLYVLVVSCAAMVAIVSLQLLLVLAWWLVTLFLGLF